MTEPTPLDRVLAALAERGCDPRPSGSGWAARCPAHDDQRASLSIGLGDDYRALVHCHAGCALDHVLAALGMRAVDLYSSREPTNGSPSPRRTLKRKAGVEWGDVDAATRDTAYRLGGDARTWDYFDAAGEHVGRVVRVDVPGRGKEVRPLRREPSGRWVMGAMPKPRPLYRLPELLVAPPNAVVYVVEGERCADTVRSLGLIATTSAGGAQGAHRADWSPLHGREAVVLPDADAVGVGYARNVMRLARAADAVAIAAMPLPAVDEGDDVVDWIGRLHAAGWSDADVREDLEERAAIVLADAGDEVRR